MQEILNYLNMYLKDSDTVLLGLSGGPDSMCLLDLLTKVKASINIVVCHVNHGVRENNKTDEEFVSDYVKKLGLTYFVMHIDSYKNGIFTEEEARKKRYEFFRSVYNKVNANCLMTAHHGDDLVESVIMRLLRGSTIDGYAGIQRERNWDGMEIVRPLLTVSKDMIHDYLVANNIPFVLDETNDLDDHLRNRIRHNILPELKKEENNYISKFLKYQNELLENSELVNNYIDKLYNKVLNKESVLKKEFNKLSNLEKKYLLRKYFKNVYGEKLELIQDKHLELVIDFVSGNSSKMSLPGGYNLYNNSDRFMISKLINNEEYCIELKERCILNNGYEIRKIDSYEGSSNYEIHLNSKNIKLPLFVRTRCNGMKMQVKNLKGSKKVNDILIDKKILGCEKDVIPIVVDSDGIVLWIPGIIKSKYDVEKNGNYDIIFKYVKGMDE